MGDDAIGRVRAALDACGLREVQIVSHREATRTAEDAARAVGTSVERIVKSLVVVGSKGAAVVLVSGSNRLDLQYLGRELGDDIRMASAVDVKRRTGFSIGGVPPLGHSEELPLLVDADLLRHDTVWAAAGAPNAVMELRPSWLVDVLRGRVVAVATYPSGERRLAEAVEPMGG